MFGYDSSFHQYLQDMKMINSWDSERRFKAFITRKMRKTYGNRKSKNRGKKAK